MMPFKISAKKPKGPRLKKSSQNSYVEIYIEEGGKVIFTPITPRTSLLFKKIAHSDQLGYSEYCG